MERPPRGRLLISHITLRGPEVEQLYRLIHAVPEISYLQLVAQLVPAGFSKGNAALDRAPLREALNFLTVAGMIAQEGSLLSEAHFRALAADEPFALALLRQLRGHPEERQQALSLVHRQLVADDTVALTVPQLRARVESGPHRHLFAWTGEKLLFWSQLAAHLGLVRRLERSAEVLLVPTLNLVEMALRQVAGSVEGPLLLDDLLQALDSELFACFTARGRIHTGLAQTLVSMHRSSRLRLVHLADAARSHRLGHWRVSHLHWEV